MVLHKVILDSFGASGDGGCYGSSNSRSTCHSVIILLHICGSLLPSPTPTSPTHMTLKSKTRRAKQEYPTPLAFSLGAMILEKIRGGELGQGRLLRSTVAIEHCGHQAMLGPGVERSQSKQETSTELFVWLLQERILPPHSSAVLGWSQ